MKKFIAVVAYCLPLLAFAQPEKGTVLLSGNVAFNKGEDGQIVAPTRTTQSDFSAYVGYFVSPGVAVGVMGDYSTIEWAQDASNSFGKTITRQRGFGAAPFVRYYHPVTERFFFFVEGNAGYAGNSYRVSQSDPMQSYKTKSSGLSVNIRPGISYFIAKRWAVELLLGSLTYNNMKYTDSSGESKNTDSFRLNFLTRGVAPSVLFTF